MNVSRTEAALYALACLLLPGLSCYVYLDWPSVQSRTTSLHLAYHERQERDWTPVTPPKTYHMATILPAGEYRMPGSDG